MPSWSLFRGWHAFTTVGAHRRVFVKLPGLFRPSPTALAAFEALRDQYQSFLPAVQESLWSDYLAYREAVSAGEATEGALVSVQGPSAISAHVTLVHVEMEPYGVADTSQLGFDVAWDPDHTKGITIEHGRVVHLNGSIRAWA